MAYPASRSVVTELHIGVHEGCQNIPAPGKDWGGPHDVRSATPIKDCGQGEEVDSR
jgi:hypothetical protein